MNKFWNVVNENSEILLYGAIASEKSWLGDEATPREFADDLASLGGKSVTVRINSGGGDVFAAHAIYSQLKNYKGKVTVMIDGFAASAATIVAMAGDVITMPANAMFMIHNPMVGLDDYYNASELTDLADTLDKIKESIMQAYLGRCKVTKNQLSEMMNNETWLTADECLTYGFIDKIQGKNVKSSLNNNLLVVNSIEFPAGDYKKLEGYLAKIQNAEKGGSPMTKLEELINKISFLFEDVKPEAKEENVVDEKKVDVEALRIESLEALRSENKYVNAIIDVAKENGANAESVKPFIDAVIVAGKVEEKAQNLFDDMLKDNQDSNVNKIESAPVEQKEDNESLQNARFMNLMVNTMNEKNGGKK